MSVSREKLNVQQSVKCFIPEMWQGKDGGMQSPGEGIHPVQLQGKPHLHIDANNVLVLEPAGLSSTGWHFLSKGGRDQKE